LSATATVAAPCAPPAIARPASSAWTAAGADLDITSADGVRLLVRPMHGFDGAALAAAVAHLSPRSRYLRFLTPKPRLTRREIASLTDLDHHAREALIATEPTSGAWVAVARYAAFADDPLTADVAVTVADPWQQRGVGSALVALLVERARQEGIARLQATTLAGNLPALRLLLRQGFERSSRDRDTLELARDLTAAHVVRTGAA
jgi:RimJ/RimL family protein N-acetyltransferase